MLFVRDLSVTFPLPQGRVQALRRVSFSLREGERWVVLGESGGGKTVLALTIIGFLPAHTILDGEC